MPAISPRFGEFLIKTTAARDVDDALHKVFLDYLELKLKSLNEAIADSFVKSLFCGSTSSPRTE